VPLKRHVNDDVEIKEKSLFNSPGQLAEAKEILKPIQQDELDKNIERPDVAYLGYQEFLKSKKHPSGTSTNKVSYLTAPSVPNVPSSLKERLLQSRIKRK